MQNCKFWLMRKKGEVIYGGHCILRLSAIYNYAVDIVFLWCQIAHASVTVTVV